MKKKKEILSKQRSNEIKRCVSGSNFIRCQNCGKKAIDGFYKACSGGCAKISARKEMNAITGLIKSLKLPKVKLHL